MAEKKADIDKVITNAGTEKRSLKRKQKEKFRGFFQDFLSIHHKLHCFYSDDLLSVILSNSVTWSAVHTSLISSSPLLYSSRTKRFSQKRKDLGK